MRRFGSFWLKYLMHFLLKRGGFSKRERLGKMRVCSSRKIECGAWRSWSRVSGTKKHQHSSTTRLTQSFFFFSGKIMKLKISWRLHHLKSTLHLLLFLVWKKAAHQKTTHALESQRLGRCTTRSWSRSLEIFWFFVLFPQKAGCLGLQPKRLEAWVFSHHFCTWGYIYIYSFLIFKCHCNLMRTRFWCYFLFGIGCGFTS